MTRRGADVEAIRPVARWRADRSGAARIYARPTEPPAIQERGRGEASPATPWSAHLRRVERALGQLDVSAALRAWEHAHLAAVESLSWEGLVAAGHAYLRIGQATGAPQTAEATARRAYFAALYRACRENSFEGILQAADAFAALGDRDVVDECLGLAELLADAGDRPERLRALAARLGSDRAASAASASPTR